MPLPADTPIAADSAQKVAWLADIVKREGVSINTTQCNMPTYWAPWGTQRFKVILDHPSYTHPALARAWDSVPIPSDARPANCGDDNFAILQRHPRGRVSEWEFGGAKQTPAGQWIATWGGAIDNVKRDRGVASIWQWRNADSPNPVAREGDATWNVTAAGISMIAGVIEYPEIESGRIDHALSIAVPDALRGSFLWPAQRSDGGITDDPNAALEGSHFRLNPRFDVAAMAAPPLVKMMAQAAQRYGIVIRDRTFVGAVFYMGLSRHGETINGPLLGGLSSRDALESFPWGDLELVKSLPCFHSGACNLTPRAVISVSRVNKKVFYLSTFLSALNYPRTMVTWTIGGHHVRSGNNVGLRYVLPKLPVTVSVAIKTEDGRVVRTVRRITRRGVLPSASMSIPPSRQFLPAGS